MAAWKKYVWIIGALLLVGILWSLNISRIVGIIANANPKWVLVALIAGLSTVIGKGFKWRELLFSNKEKMPLLESIEVFLKGFFLSMVTPGRIGDFSRALFIRKKFGFVTALSSVVLDRLIDIAMLLVFSLLALLAFFELSNQWIFNPWIVVAGLAILCIATAYVLRRQQKGFFRSIFLSFIPEEYANRVRESYEALVGELQKSVSRPVLLLVPVGAGIVNWCLSATAGIAVGISLGLSPPVYFFVIVVLILALVDMVPVSIGGVGTREAGSIVLFSAVGIGAETAVAYSLLYFAVAYVPVTVLGGLLFIQKPLPK